MNDQKFVKVSDLFRCETCYHTSPKGCALGAFACDLGEAYRPSMSLLPTLTLDDLRPKGRWIVDGILNNSTKICHCSECLTGEAITKNLIPLFCWKCGADMRGGGEDG